MKNIYSNGSTRKSNHYTLYALRIFRYKDAYKGDKTIGVVSQKNDTIEDPSVEDLNKIGTVAHIIKMLRMPDGNTTVIIQGKKRFQLKDITQTEPYFKATIIPFSEISPAKDNQEFEALTSSLKDMALQIIKLSPNILAKRDLHCAILKVLHFW